MSLVATRLQNWRIENPELDRNMARPLEYGALDFFIEQTDAPNSIISPYLRNRAFASMGNTVQVPVINYDGDVTVSNTRSCVISDDENTSALYTVVWTTYSVGFTMVPTLYMNNEIDYQHDFERKMEKICRALATTLDSAAITALEAAKTQVLKDPLQYSFSSNTIAVPTQMATEILGDLNPMMRANAYPQMIHLVGNAGVDSLIRKLAQHGVYNDVNKRMEYDNKIIHYTNNVLNAEGKNGTAFAVVDGNVGVLTRVDRASLKRDNVNFHQWDVVRLPYIDLPVGSHYYTEVGDQSGIAGAASADMVCDGKEFFSFSVDVAYIVAYNSAPETVANPIIKVAIDAPEQNQPYGTPVYITNADQIGDGGNDGSIELDTKVASLNVNATKQLVASVKPSGTAVTYSSSDTDVAEVSATGLITAKAAGTAIITAEIYVGGATYTDECVVVVSAVPTITLDKDTLSLTAAGATGSLEATTTPEAYAVEWDSSDDAVATVEGGVVTPLTAGTATITAKITVGGVEYSDTCEVTVSA